MKYNKKVVVAYFKECGLPEPMLEHKFHPERKWRFDFSWDLADGTDMSAMLALEVQGGIWMPRGGHNTGTALRKEHEKRNNAAALGWRILYVEPKDLCMQSTVDLIKKCLGI